MHKNYNKKNVSIFQQRLCDWIRYCNITGAPLLLESNCCTSCWYFVLFGFWYLFCFNHIINNTNQPIFLRKCIAVMLLMCEITKQFQHNVSKGKKRVHVVQTNEYTTVCRHELRSSKVSLSQNCIACLILDDDNFS